MKLERFISPEYLKQQRWLHSLPKGYGGKGDKWADAVVQIATDLGCDSILDYGCGQGTLIKAVRRKLPSWELAEYDPAVQGKDLITKGKTFDLVTCTDVLEHVEPDKLAVVIDHIYRLSNKAVFLVIATRPSNKFFRDGRNVHLIIEPASWWKERLDHPHFEFLEPPPSPMEQASREYVVLMRRK